MRSLSHVSAAGVRLKPGRLAARLTSRHFGCLSEVCSSLSSRQRRSDKFRHPLLPVPFGASLEAVYLPTRIEQHDYPDLIQPGGEVPTVATGMVLLAAKGERAQIRAKAFLLLMRRYACTGTLIGRSRESSSIMRP